MQEPGSAKVMHACLLMLCVIGLALAGCASYSPAPATSAVLTLAKAEERTSRLGLRITFPAGDYIPDFANESGVYYLAPSSVMFATWE